MALDKEIENENGETARYWRPTIINIDDLAGIMQVQMYGWKTQAKRNNNKPHIMVRNFTWTIEEFPNMKVSTSKAEIYSQIKKHPDFADAIDV